MQPPCLTPQLPKKLQLFQYTIVHINKVHVHPAFFTNLETTTKKKQNKKKSIFHQPGQHGVTPLTPPH